VEMRISSLGGGVERRSFVTRFFQYDAPVR
jgi:hypothetical protein